MGTPPDAKLTLMVDWPEFTLDTLTRVTSLWSDVIKEVGTDVVGRRRSVKCVLKGISFSSPLEVHAAPALARRYVDPSTLSAISRAVVSGFHHLAEHEDRPDHFSTRALELTRTLSLLTDQGRIVVSNGVGEPAALTIRIASTVDGILGPALESYGSVEGRLEGIITHGRRRFFVYDSLSGCQVRCFFDDSTSIGDLLKYFERRVIVSGLVRSKAFTGQPTSIRVSDIDGLRPDSELLSTREVLSKWEHAR